MQAGLYIHIPFCKKRCNYCDFYTFGGNNSVSQEYVQAIKKEISKYKHITWKTVYFGGGTPSLMSPQQVEYIIGDLDIQKNAEITIEINPETVDYQKYSGYKAVGVNRISIGVQTAQDTSLKTIGRIHSKDSIYLAFDNAKKAGFVNISGDMIIGLPNYTYQELDDTIRLLSDLQATHISSYILKVEEGTPFHRMKNLNIPDEEKISDFYMYTCKELEKNGYNQYEISNFAKDGYKSQHNSIYWNLENYVGIGPSAHSCLNGERFYYQADIREFMTNPQNVLDGKIDVDDYIMLSLRLKRGLDLEKLKKQWNKTLTPLQMNKIKMLEKNEYLKVQDNIISLTPKGFLVENQIACDIMR